MKLRLVLSLTFTLTTISLFCPSLLPIAHGQSDQRGLHIQKAAKESRVALVIGNSDYKTIKPLGQNPVNDAKDIAQILRDLGFEVIYGDDETRDGMKRLIRAFGDRIRDGSIGLFYYAGHGVQVKGINYLVPVDAQLRSEEEIEYDCVEVGFVLAQMESARNRMNIMILDACRNNPFRSSDRSASRGLALMSAPSGTLIAYATAPGSVASDGGARNGIYTQELLKHIRTSGLTIEEVFKRVRLSVRNLTKNEQTPWESSSLINDFYFIDPDIPLTNPSCENESNLRSLEGSSETAFTLTNRSKIALITYWLDDQGKRVKYAEVPPGYKIEQKTFTTHPWVVADARGKCIRILAPPGDFVIK
ncbi:MAG TPA: caspase domain-containing protein [Blastocatellia bacterium]|nr:caspase domain-containing protein [Blastocatellia bacterium]